MTTRTIVVRTAAVAISIALLAWLAADARWHGVAARIVRLDPAALVGVALLFAASYAMRAGRIHGEFRDEIGAGAYLRILRLTLVHNALVNVLPFRSGEAAFPVLLGRWFGIGTGRAVVSLLWLRAQDAAVVLALAALVWPGLPIAARAAALAALACGAWAVPAWARRHDAAPAETSASASRWTTLHALLARSTKSSVAGWSWTLGNWIVKLIAETWLLSLTLAPTDAAGPVAPIGVAALGAVGAELAAILPIQGVAGFGTFEAGAAALMRIEQVPLATGLEAALVLHAVVLALALLAGLAAAVALPGPPERPAERA